MLTPRERDVSGIRALPRFARDCLCGTDPATGEQVTWCQQHNGWVEACKQDGLRQEAERRLQSVHEFLKGV